MPTETTYIDTGVVREIRTDPQSSIPGSIRYWVEIVASGTCASCALTENCHGVGSMVWATSAADLRVGQSIHLELGPGTILKATGWIYGIPLIGLVAGILVGYSWLFAGMAEGARVLLSTATGFGMILTAGAMMSRVNQRISKNMGLRATPIRK